MTNGARGYRDGKMTIAWQPDGLIGRVSLNREHWASVEWSEKHQAWCIEDVEGRCLAHAASISGQVKSELQGNTRALLVSRRPSSSRSCSGVSSKTADSMTTVDICALRPCAGLKELD
jgi:hypothetical protein